MILLALAVAAAQPAETPREFIGRLYAEYQKEGFSPLAQPGDLFSSGLAAAIQKDSSGGDVGYLDGDPLCDCQDYQRLSAKILQVRQPSRSTAVADVHLVLGPKEARDLQIRLVRTQSGWRIGDVVGSDHQSLLRELQRANAKR